MAAAAAVVDPGLKADQHFKQRARLCAGLTHVCAQRAVIAVMYTTVKDDTQITSRAPANVPHRTTRSDTVPRLLRCLQLHRGARRPNARARARQC